MNIDDRNEYYQIKKLRMIEESITAVFRSGEEHGAKAERARIVALLRKWDIMLAQVADRIERGEQ